MATKQTMSLCESMPRLASRYMAGDELPSEWIIVRWEGKSPKEVEVGDLRRLASFKRKDEAGVVIAEIPNSFKSRTEALRYSASLLKGRGLEGLSEAGSWGCWNWREGSKSRCQSVICIPRRSAEASLEISESGLLESPVKASPSLAGKPQEAKAAKPAPKSGKAAQNAVIRKASPAEAEAAKSAERGSVASLKPKSVEQAVSEIEAEAKPVSAEEIKSALEARQIA